MSTFTNRHGYTENPYGKLYKNQREYSMLTPDMEQLLFQPVLQAVSIFHFADVLAMNTDIHLCHLLGINESRGGYSVKNRTLKSFRKALQQYMDTNLLDLRENDTHVVTWEVLAEDIKEFLKEWYIGTKEEDRLNIDGTNMYKQMYCGFPKHRHEDVQ